MPAEPAATNTSIFWFQSPDREISLELYARHPHGDWQRPIEAFKKLARTYGAEAKEISGVPEEEWESYFTFFSAGGPNA